MSEVALLGTSVNIELFLKKTGSVEFIISCNFIYDLYVLKELSLNPAYLMFL